MTRKRLFTILGNLVLVPAVLGLVVFVGSYFSILPFKFYIVLSGSMEPAIKTGSVVVGIKEAFYSPGEVVTFSPNGNNKDFVTHRISTVVDRGVYYSERFRTKGDANKTEDQWEIDSSKIVGRVLFTIPYLGYMANFSKNPRGFILLVIVPATIIIYEELKTVFFELRKSLKKKRELIIIPETQAYETREEFRIPKQSIILPIIGALFITFLVTGAFFTDIETSTFNIIQVAASYITSSPDQVGTVVINEINWGGSNGDGNDEWIELKNTTSNVIDLSNWVVERLGTGSGPGANITIPAGNTIPANGFFIISNNSKDSSKINVDSDYVTSSVSLVDGGEQLILKDSSDAIIDMANGTGSWFAGSNSTPKKSMERKNPPSDGTQTANWQTATTHTNMDGSGATDEFATPKAENGT